jgi:hypothetical protein
MRIVEVKLHSFLMLALHKVNGQSHAMAVIPVGTVTCIISAGAWVGPRILRRRDKSLVPDRI